MQDHLIKGGLTELPAKKPGEQVDFSAAAVFGSMRAQDLPTGDFIVAPPEGIDDQGDNDFCTFSSSTSVSEDQEAVELEYLWNAFVGKVLVQKDPESWGCDLRTACMTHVKYGGLEAEYSPFRHYTKMPTREEVLDPKTWGDEKGIEEYKMMAFEHRKNSVFEVESGPHDKFDNMRSQLWLNRGAMRSIVTGCKWRHAWTDIQGGVIPPEVPEGPYTPHSFKVCGQKIIDGRPHLVAQLSNGDKIGDKGFFYFPREVVNTEFTFGNFMFNDIGREEAEAHLYYKTSVRDSFIKKYYKVACRFIADLIW